MSTFIGYIDSDLHAAAIVIAHRLRKVGAITVAVRDSSIHALPTTSRVLRSLPIACEVGTYTQQSGAKEIREDLECWRDEAIDSCARDAA